MYIGESGISRAIQRTCQVMKESGPTTGQRFARQARSTSRRFSAISTFTTASPSICSAPINRPMRRLSTRRVSRDGVGETRRKDDRVLRGATYRPLDIVTARSSIGSADAERA